MILAFVKHLAMLTKISHKLLDIQDISVDGLIEKLKFSKISLEPMADIPKY